jgi:hypothetical protein
MANRPDNDTVEDWEHPLFMKALPSGDHPEAGTLDALSSLIFEDKTPAQIAEHFKQQVSAHVWRSTFAILVCKLFFLY